MIRPSTSALSAAGELPSVPWLHGPPPMDVTAVLVRR